MQSEKRKLSQGAMLTREFIFFTLHLGRVRLLLLNCAEVGRRNRILTNYRFLSHSLFLYIGRKARKATYSFQSCFLCGIIGTIEK